VRIIIDSDAYNEVDDQFAIAWALKLPELLTVEAIHAAPFCYDRPPFNNVRSSSPQEGMERSYDEILKTIDRVKPERRPPVFTGATRFLGETALPHASEASTDLIDRATMPGERLVVVAIAALTNIATALLLEPSIAESISVVWLGGHPYDWPHNREFNLMQDIPAVRTVFDSGCELVHIPCKGVASHLMTSSRELHERLGERSSVGAWLTGIVDEYLRDHNDFTKTIWDVAPIAWLMDESLVETVRTTRPVLSERGKWSREGQTGTIECAYWIDRDAVFTRLFDALADSR
jgi:purine nucleosidase